MPARSSTSALFPSGTDAGLFAVGERNRIGRSFENCPYPVDIWNEKFSCIFEYSWYNDLVSNQAPDIERIPCPGLLFSRQSGYFHLRKAGITMSQRIVVALGGNALGKNLTEQYQAARETAKAIVDLIADGNQVVIAHGNGPQVGMIQTAMTELTRMDPEKYIPCPLSVCVAMSQGYIGYDLQNALRETLLERGIPKAVSTVLTQVEVDPDDPAFLHPTKPIGAFMSREEAERLVAQRGYDVVEDAGRGYRRVVASPRPRAIVELETIRALVEAGQVVIACGGGGIPVVRAEENRWKGAAAVIDKDFAAELLAESLEADLLIILTAVEKVAIRFRQPGETWLSELTPEEAEQYMRAGEFAPGSMLPKVEAAVRFARSAPGRTALITELQKARAGIAGQTGTRVREERR